MPSGGHDDPWTWFERRSYHHSRYGDLPALARTKRERDLSVSVCIPTRNEAETVGPIIRTVRDHLVDGVPLVDEIVVIDGASTDGTADAAVEAGAVVYQQDEVLPHSGPGSGKGDALWKALFVARGDLIAFIDADVRDFRPHFVSGLLGPLLESDGVRFAKAFYERPLRRPEEESPVGGGRVTELVARPLINLLFPHLAAVVQPLSGEYAATRELLESVPFFSGYGVEFGLLIDVVEKAGLEAVAQVDMDRRVHRNRDTAELAHMAFAVMQAAFARLRSSGRLRVEVPELHDLVQFVNGPDGRTPERFSLRVVERPPASSMDEYRGSARPEAATADPTASA